MRSTGEQLESEPSSDSPLDSWSGCFTLLAKILVVLGCGATLSIWLLLKLTGDAWHWGTLVMYSPRWFGLVPWLATLPAIPLVRSWQRGLIIVTGLIGLVSLLGFNLPLANFPLRRGVPLRVITCNMARDELSIPGLEALIDESEADLVLLQEFSRRDLVKWPAGWYSYGEGGLTLASRYPLDDFEICHQDPGLDRTRTLVLLATVVLPEGPLRVASIHLSTPREGLIDLLDNETLIAPDRFERLIEETNIRSAESEWARHAVKMYGPVDVIAGDFNTPLDSRIFMRDWSRFHNAFTQAGWGLGHTKFEKIDGWQVRARIDQILIGPQHHARRCWVGPDIGSDHRPVIADIAIQPSDIP